jgi:hypothetical protein
MLIAKDGMGLDSSGTAKPFHANAARKCMLHVHVQTVLLPRCLGLFRMYSTTVVLEIADLCYSNKGFAVCRCREGGSAAGEAVMTSR